MGSDPKVAGTFAIAYQEFLGIGKFRPAMKAEVHVGGVNNDMGKGTFHTPRKGVVECYGVLDVVDEFGGPGSLFEDQVAQGKS